MRAKRKQDAYALFSHRWSELCKSWQHLRMFKVFNCLLILSLSLSLWLFCLFRYLSLHHWLIPFDGYWSERTYLSKNCDAIGVLLFPYQNPVWLDHNFRIHFNLLSICWCRINYNIHTENNISIGSSTVSSFSSSFLTHCSCFLFEEMFSIIAPSMWKCAYHIMPHQLPARVLLHLAKCLNNYNNQCKATKIMKTKANEAMWMITPTII